jgi:hypothetical protein
MYPVILVLFKFANTTFDTYFIGDNGAEIIVNQTPYLMVLSMQRQMRVFVERQLATIILMILSNGK